MADYTALASVDDLKAEFGLLELAFSWEGEPAELDRALETKLQEAADEIGNTAPSLLALYSSATRTQAQTRILIRAEKLIAAASILERPEILKVLGAHEPLAMEDSPQIADLADRFYNRASGLIANLKDALDSVPTGSAFARPAFGASTFVVAETDRSPSGRNALWDESDDVSAMDLVNG